MFIGQGVRLARLGSKCGKDALDSVVGLSDLRKYCCYIILLTATVDIFACLEPGHLSIFMTSLSPE